MSVIELIIVIYVYGLLYTLGLAIAEQERKELPFWVILFSLVIWPIFLGYLHGQRDE